MEVCMVVKKEVPHNIDTLNTLLLYDNDCPRTREALILESIIIMSQSLFGVMDNFDLFEIFQTNFSYIIQTFQVLQYDMQFKKYYQKL